MSTSSKIPTDDCFSKPSNGDSALLLHFSSPGQGVYYKLIYGAYFPEYVIINVCVLLRQLKVFLSIVVMTVSIKQDDNCF